MVFAKNVHIWIKFCAYTIKHGVLSKQRIQIFRFDFFLDSVKIITGIISGIL